MKTIETTLLNVIETESKKYENSERVNSLKDSSKEFEILIQKGLITKRGYNLLSVEDVLLKRISFNKQYSNR